MNERGHASDPVLRCGRCGRFIDWDESRLQIVCTCRPHLDLLPVLVRDAAAADADKIRRLFKGQFGHTPLVAFGAVVPIDPASTLVAEAENEVGGALAWRRMDEVLHVIAVAIEPMWQRAGLGGHLVAEAELLARRLNLTRVVATISNDNIPALYFYQRRGYRITEVVPGAIAAHTGPVPPAGFAGIPVADEVHLSKPVGA